MSNDQQQLLPLGFRFYPTEEELLSFYLPNKLSKIREADIERLIPVANIYRFDPWQLPEISGEPCIRESEQFFFCPQQPREAHGGRPARTTPSGYWKATGSPGPVYSSTHRTRVLGVKKTMVFYRGRAPTGSRTKWKMDEYRVLENVEAMNIPGFTPKLRNEFSLCRVHKNSGCMRAFDRRPAMVATASENPRAQSAVSDSGGNCSGCKRARSQESSSADDELDISNPPSPQGAMDLKMIEDFDWDKLDWV